MSDVVSVPLTRTELVSLRETIEMTPVFKGRAEARDAIREVLRDATPPPLQIDESIVVALARRIVPIDVPTARLRSKLDLALAEWRAATAPDAAAGWA